MEAMRSTFLTTQAENSTLADSRFADPSYVPWLTRMLQDLTRVVVAPSVRDPFNVGLGPKEREIRLDDPKTLVSLRERAVANITQKLLKDQHRKQYIEHQIESIRKQLENTKRKPLEVPIQHYRELQRYYVDLSRFAPTPLTTWAEEDAELFIQYHSDYAMHSMEPLLGGAKQGSYQAILSLLHIASCITSVLHECHKDHADVESEIAQRYPYWPFLLNSRKQSFKEARSRIKELGVGANFIKWPPRVTSAMLTQKLLLTDDARPRDIANAYAISLCHNIHTSRIRLRERLRKIISDALLFVHPTDHKKYIRVLGSLYDASDKALKTTALRILEEYEIPVTLALRGQLRMADEGEEVRRMLAQMTTSYPWHVATLPPFSKKTADKWWKLAEQILVDKYGETDKAKVGRFSFIEKNGRESQLMRLAGDTTAPCLPKFEASDILDQPSLIAKLKSKSDPVSAFLFQQMSSAMQNTLAAYKGPALNPTPLNVALAKELTTIITQHTLYDKQRFDGHELRKKTYKLRKRHPRGKGLARLNRMLLEDAYPKELMRTPIAWSLIESRIVDDKLRRAFFRLAPTAARVS